MQTVNFRCGHCNDLMAVGVESLGQQVRCPHCQEVVVAPAEAAPAPAPAVPTPAVPAPAPTRQAAPADELFRGLTDNDDIFSPSSRPTDSLFDDPAPHRLEMPSGPPGPLPTPAPAPPPEVALPSPELTVSHTPGSPFAGPQPATPAYPLLADLPAPAVTATPHDAGGPAADWMGPSANAGEAAPGGDQPAAPRRARDPKAGKVNWFIPLVFLPLVLYAALATVAAGYLYLKAATARPSMFEAMPDVEGDTPGTRPAKPKAGAFLSITPEMATQPLPEHLRVSLGSTLRVGDVEVTPTGLERRKVAILSEGSEDRPEESALPALVLKLRLTNRASDYAFTPLDNYFDRKWSSGDGSTPLTLLRAGPVTFFGGPARWYPLDGNRDRRPPRDWVEGRKNVDRRGIGPGETAETFVCTDAWNPAVALHLFGTDEEGRARRKPYAGKLQWRVQLRRGLVPYRGKQVPATAVIGVDFTAADVPAAAG